MKQDINVKEWYLQVSCNYSNGSKDAWKISGFDGFQTQASQVIIRCYDQLG